MYTLENWALIQENPYASPEMGLSFNGKVYGHPRFPDGHQVTTSPIMEVLEGGIVKTQSGSVYLLGKVNKQYDEMFPNSLDRLIKQSKIVNNK